LEGEMPYYDIEEFLRACGTDQSNIFIFQSALKDASEFFGLKTKTQLLGFICNGGLEKLEFQNSNHWKNNPDKEAPIYIDAYEFVTVCRLGYIAFMHNNKTKKWIIKSFKPSENSNPSMRIALMKARDSGLIPGTCVDPGEKHE
jgi:hypothetical protein